MKNKHLNKKLSKNVKPTKALLKSFPAYSEALIEK
jgi:hypothetical protein